ncbi:rCG36361 [Rattus norvegicus]|uniref:RCG36361 n=1 Tax=Rattus norvegicus TaxID=10116 RepID=A6IPS4_RAT|nr:synaptobrevin homolog YKT6-like [Rattus norvegicus]EDL96089.1 rCG36361 [Rattus norvegicus]
MFKGVYNMSSFSVFQRFSVQEFMTFTSQLVAEYSAKGSRDSVEEQVYFCHVYIRSDGLAGVVIANNVYLSRVAFTLLEKVLDEFFKRVDRIDWPVGSPATRYQNCQEADPISTS